MSLSDFLQPSIIEAIERLGFPTVLILILIWMINYMIKKNEQRQTLSDQRYQELVKVFVKQMQEITDKHTKSVENITKEFHDVTTKIDNRMQICMKEKEHNVEKIINKLENIEDLIKEDNKK